MTSSALAAFLPEMVMWLLPAAMRIAASLPIPSVPPVIRTRVIRSTGGFWNGAYVANSTRFIHPTGSAHFPTSPAHLETRQRWGIDDMAKGNKGKMNWKTGKTRENMRLKGFGALENGGRSKKIFGNKIFFFFFEIWNFYFLDFQIFVEFFVMISDNLISRKNIKHWKKFFFSIQKFFLQFQECFLSFQWVIILIRLYVHDFYENF